MKYTIRKIVLLLLACIILVGTGYGVISFDDKKGLHALSGEPVSKEGVTNAAPIIVLMYWHVNCSYCLEQIAELNSLQMDFDLYYTQTDQVLGYVIGINVLDNDTQIKEYWSIHNPKFPTLAGGESPTSGTPVVEIYVQGQLHKTFVGLTTYDKITKAIVAVMEEE